MYPLSKINKSLFLQNSAILKNYKCFHCRLIRHGIPYTVSRSCSSRPPCIVPSPHPLTRTPLSTGHPHPLTRIGRRHNVLPVRTLHVTSRLRYDEPLKPSSKIEETVQALKEKAKEKEKLKTTTGSKPPAESEAAPVVKPPVKESTVKAVPVPAEGALEAAKPVEVEVKKSLGQKIWTEVLHYYHGFRLLGLDIKLSIVLVWRILNGKQLSRREHNLLIRTTGDIFRLIPFSVFIIVPFMELLLPVFIKFFPGMLPSQFATTKEKENKMKQSLKVKLEMAKFLQKTLDNMGVAGKGRSSQSAKEFSEFYEKVRSKGMDTSTEDIMKFSRLFQDEITLDSLSRPQLQALCRVVELHPIGTSNFLRFQLRLKLRSLAADDKQIQREGVGLLTQEELQNACKARGMRAYGVPKERLQTQLKQWLDLSLNEKVPPSLLLLSRAFMLPETTPTTEILKQAISELPETVAVSAKAAIDEIEGKVDNKTKLLVLKEEERRIKEEKAEYLEEKLQIEKEQKRKEQELAQKESDDGELLTDKAETLIDKAAVLEPQVLNSASDDLVQLVKEKEAEARKADEESMVESADLQVVEDALEAFGKDKSQMLVEKHELADLREEMEDYQEDLKDLEEAVKTLDSSSREAQTLKESKAANRLFKRVNKMINNMDKVIDDLSRKEKALKEDLSEAKPEVDSAQQSAELVKIDELINALRKIQQVPDASKLKRIAEVLDRMDADHDGSIRVEAVLKVLELIGEENVKLSKKQFEEIVAMVNKEEAIELEEQLDKVLKAKLKGGSSKIPEGEQSIAKDASCAAAPAPSKPSDPQATSLPPACGVPPPLGQPKSSAGPADKKL